MPVDIQEFLTLGQDDLPFSVRLLLAEYCKYTLTRAWYFYPSELPEEALAKEIRNGHIDRTLAFPLEDLYAEGFPAGQVGQELYGCGAAFTFASRSYHAIKDAPFLFYCEYPMYEPEMVDVHCALIRLRGMEGFSCRARILPLPDRELPAVHMSRQDDGKTALKGRKTKEGHLEFELPANIPLRLRWNETE